jgi:hypothetical protein
MVKDAQEEVLSTTKENNTLDGKGASLVADIDSLIDQTLQIYELTSKEDEIIESIGSSISILLTTLKVSLSLSQSIFQNDFPAIKSAILNSNAEIIIMQASGNIVTKKFSELDSSQVMNIMSEIVPKLGESAEAKKVEVTEKIEVMRKIAKQFQRVKVEMKPEHAAKEEE